MRWQDAETIAKSILKSQGYRIIHSNTYGPFDIVCHRNNYTRLIQVKLRNKIRSKKLAQQIAEEVLDNYKGKEFLPSDVCCEAWIFYHKDSNYEISVKCSKGIH